MKKNQTEVKSVYNEDTKIYTHTNETYKVKLRKQCLLNRLPKNCSIYKFTSGGCDSCGQNIKLKPPKPAMPKSIEII
jgi:hypothetical protein